MDARSRAQRLQALIVSPAAFGQYLAPMARTHRLLGLLFAAGASVGACTDVGMGEATSTSDSTGGECLVGQVGCRCTTGGSCDPGLLCASMTCVEPDPGTSTTEVTTTVDPTTSTGTSGGDECNPAGNGGNDPACMAASPDRPYCVKGDCVDCTGISCEAVSPSLPLCDPETGKCAACLCDDAAPVCDPVAHTCGACTSHDECPDSACNLWTGGCIAAADTLWVIGSGCDDDGAGSEDAPLCTLHAAFARIGGEPAGEYAVRVHPGTYPVANPLRASTGHTVALVQAGGGAEVGVEIVASESPAIAIDADGKLLVDGVRLSDGGSDGLSCSSGEAWLDRLTVEASAGRGISADDCEIKLRRGVLVANTIAGAEMRGGSLRLENSFITANGNNQNGGGGVYLALGASVDAVYTTWVLNLGQAGTPFAVACDEDADKETVSVRNSVAINKGLNTLCEGATVKNTAWSNDPPGSGNISVDYTMLAQFLTADMGLAGVYRAIAGTTIDQLAMWQVGDPAIDFDGDERPSGANSPDFAGADRVAR